MNGLFGRGLFYLCCGMGGAHLYNRSVVKCNIKILQEEIQNTKNDAYLTKKLKETLLKQRLYEGRLMYLLPPPRFDINEFTTVVDPRAYPT